MRMRRAHHRGVGLAVEVEVVGVAALAGEQPLIFLAADRMADGAERGAGGKFYLLVHGCRILHCHSPTCRGLHGLKAMRQSRAGLRELTPGLIVERHGVELEPVVHQLVAEPARHLGLELFDLFRLELDHLSGAQVDQVVVV
jgi:hypothetical protein